MTDDQKRLLPQEPLPPYAYVPGAGFPHPVRDPRGHSYQAEPLPPVLPLPDDWRDCPLYLHGIELFNHGFYWEAHESWEALWQAAGRKGPMAEFLKGLIKLAAAGVKAREGRAAGVRRHAQRARQLFEATGDFIAPAGDRYMGLSLPWLVDQASKLVHQPESAIDTRAAPVVCVMPFQLRPD